MVEEVRRAVHDENADMRRRPRIGPVERALADAGKGDELRIGLRLRQAGHNAEKDDERERDAAHGNSPSTSERN
jgi:hypothetical protein